MLNQCHPRRHQSLLGLVVAALWLVPAGAQEAGSLERDMPAALTSCSFPEGSGVANTRRSVYVPMADGVRLAVDICLPKPMPREAKLPALYTATPYWRAEEGVPLSPTQRSWVAGAPRRDGQDGGAPFDQIGYSARIREDEIVGET